MRQYSNMNTFHASHGSRVPVKYQRTLEVCRLEYLKTSRMRQYPNMNTFHTSHESRVPVEHHITLKVCRLEYLKTSRMRQYSNMNTFSTSHESRVPVANSRTTGSIRKCSSHKWSLCLRRTSNATLIYQNVARMIYRTFRVIHEYSI